MTGRRRKVLRLVSALALLAVVAAGCGSAAQPRRSADRGVPKALARGWEREAAAVAEAATTGDDCGARRLADTLRDQVVARRRRVPLRLRSALLTGVKALADSTTCPPPPPAPVTKQPPTRPPPPGKHDHGHHGRGGHYGHRRPGGGKDK